MKRRPDAWATHTQESVMQDYKRCPAFRDKEDEAALHLFFSPNRVPTDLTDEEVLVCIALYPWKRDWQERERQKLRRKILQEMGDLPEDFPCSKEDLASANSIGRPATLPEELITDRMTRTRFQKGIRKLLKLLVTR